MKITTLLALRCAGTSPHRHLSLHWPLLRVSCLFVVSTASASSSPVASCASPLPSPILLLLPLLASSPRRLSASVASPPRPSAYAVLLLERRSPMMPLLLLLLLLLLFPLLLPLLASSSSSVISHDLRATAAPRSPSGSPPPSLSHPRTVVAAHGSQGPGLSWTNTLLLPLTRSPDLTVKIVGFHPHRSSLAVMDALISYTAALGDDLGHLRCPLRSGHGLVTVLNMCKHESAAVSRTDTMHGEWAGNLSFISIRKYPGNTNYLPYQSFT